MGDRAITMISIFFFVCATATIISVAKYWFGRTRGANPRQLDEISERLSRLEQAVDAIAVETERISEGQRFTTKLLSERTKALAESVQR